MTVAKEVLEIYAANDLAEDISKYLLESLHVTAVHRLANLLDKGQETAQADSVVLDHIPSLQGDANRNKKRIARADLKQAVMEAQCINELYLKRKAAGMSVDDQEGPLPIYAQTNMQKSWDIRYHYALLPSERLSPFQRGKLGRELEKAGFTVWQISKVRIAKQASHDKGPKLQDIGSIPGHIQLRVSADPDEEEMTSLDVHGYLDKLVVYCNDLAFVGIHARTPAGERIADGQPGSNQPYVAWDTARHYALNVKEKAQEPLPDGRLPSLQQIINADEATRTDWMNLTSESQGADRKILNEAIKGSFQFSMQHWKWAARDGSGGFVIASPAAPLGDLSGSCLPAKRRDTLPHTALEHKGQAIWKMYNDNRNCPIPCSGKNLHVCDVLIGNKKACGSSSPSRNQCPHAEASKQYTR